MLKLALLLLFLQTLDLLGQHFLFLLHGDLLLLRDFWIFAGFLVSALLHQLRDGWGAGTHWRRWRVIPHPVHLTLTLSNKTHWWVLELKIIWRSFAISAATLTESLWQFHSTDYKYRVQNECFCTKDKWLIMLFIILWFDLFMPARVRPTFLHYDTNCILLQSLKTGPKSHLVYDKCFHFGPWMDNTDSLQPKAFTFLNEFDCSLPEKASKKRVKYQAQGVNAIPSHAVQHYENEGDSVHINIVLSD